MFNFFNRATKAKQAMPKRYWRFDYANRFLKKHREDIDLFELRMFNDEDVCETFIENGYTIRDLGMTYQLYKGNVDGVVYTNIDIPCIHVIYKGGAEEWIACYEDFNNDEPASVRYRKLDR